MATRMPVHGEPEGIVIYGAGSVGRKVADVCQSRGWRVVGAVNRAGPKIGKPLTNRGPIISSTLGEALGSQPVDIAIVTVGDDIQANLPIYRECFAAGLNVICSGCESSFPEAVSADIAREIDCESKASGVTFCGSGFQDISRVWLLRCLVAACNQVRSIKHHSRADAGKHGPHTLRLAGIGLTPAEFDELRLRRQNGVSPYRVFVHQCALAIGLTPTVVQQDLVPLFDISDASCTRGTRFLTTLETTEGIKIAADNELGFLAKGASETFDWSVEGDGGGTISLSGIDTSLSTAAQIGNRIPTVLAAPPGLVTVDTMQFPLVLGSWLR